MSANDRRIPFDAPCPGIGEARQPARDRIISEAMLGRGAFILLKVGRGRRESAKQAEIRLATLLKILRISPPEPRKPAKKSVGVVSAAFSAGHG
jgi:hypothetical protein